MDATKTILVTGGAGFIGGCFVRRSIAGNERFIINLDKLTYAGNVDSLQSVWHNSNHRFVRGDIGDHLFVDSLLAEYQPSAIVNFAAESHVDRSIDGPMLFVETNVHATCKLLESARRYWQNLDGALRDAFRFLHVSTDEVFGALGKTGRFAESTPYAPNSPYSASKAASDHFVRAYHHTYGLPTLTTNCSNNYGPYQFPEKLIPLMIVNALEGKSLPVYGDGSHVRDWLFVDDHCAAIDSVLEKGRVGESYNIGGDAERSNLEVVELVCETVDRLRPELKHKPSSQLIDFVADRPGHDQRYAIDANKIRNELDWRPTRDFESGIEETVAWYLDNPEWLQRVTDGTYQQERLGLGEND